MAKTNRQDYMLGMEHALDVVKKAPNVEEGVKALELEMRYRAEKPLPLNISPYELTAYVRAQDEVKHELLVQAVALADAVQRRMKFPPSTVKKFLDAYNTAVDEIRYDDEALKKRANELDKNSSLNGAVKKYLEERGNSNE